jgi:type VI secretion system protein ImpL
MPRSPQTRWVAAAAALFVFALAAWLLGAAFTLTAGERAVLRGGLVVLGVALAAALVWFLRPTAPVAAPRAAGDDALGALAAARARLGRGAFAVRPVVLVVGTAGSCKTTVVTRAGLDPVLLAGDAPATAPGAAPPPTAAANVWLAGADASGGTSGGGAVLAEAGGAVFADPARWRAFVRALRAPRLGAALGRREPAPRAAVLCVSADVFYAGGDQADRLAQLARERLADAARELGVALPVYVVFTKADRLPQFEPWAAPLAGDEVRLPLGAALPFDAAAGAPASAGGYAERLAPRLDDAFGALVSTLAGRRLELLGRESVADRRLAAYEFPREVAKLAPAASRFLAEVCRPLQLGVAAQLRGFYFVGARPVVVGDLAPAAAQAAPAQAAAAVASNATHAFVPGRMPPPGGAGTAGAVPYGAPYGPPATRRVPQWTFLDRLFPDVILADRGAAAAARGGVRVAALRRGLLGAGVAAAAVLAAMVARSWAGNRALVDRAAEAARGVAALPDVAGPAGTTAMPSLEALRRLDALRAVLDTVRGYEEAGVPTRLGLGLWQGDAVAASGGRAWLAGYRRQLHDGAWAALVDTLRMLPDSARPGDDYGRVYGQLKTYIVGTTEPAKSTVDPVAPVLLAAWRGDRNVDAAATELARRNFEFYARELKGRVSWTTAGDAGVVRRARTFLGRFEGPEPIYQAMLADASAKAPPARLGDLAPRAPGVLNAPGDVPGAFTDSGWKLMRHAFANADDYFRGEAWVVGDARAAQAQDRDRVLAEIRTRYRAEYVERWRAWVRGLRVVPAGAARDAAQRIGAFGSPQSPLLAALALAARHTAVDSGMAAAFQPVHQVTPPRAAQFVGEANQAYANGLLTLQAAVERVADLPVTMDTVGAEQMAQAGQQGVVEAQQAKVAARQLTLKFAIDTAAAAVAGPVSALLVAPIELADPTLRAAILRRAPPARQAPAVAAAGGAPAAPPPPPARADLAALNARGAALCAAAAPVLAKFPFSPDARDEATIGEVNSLFAPGTGTLWGLYHEKLEPYLEKQGDRYAPRAGAPAVLSGAFVTFFNQAARTSEALYGAAGTAPAVALRVRSATPRRALQLSQGAVVARLGGNAPPAALSWPSTSGREAKLVVSEREFIVLGKTRTVARAGGEWALFRLAAAAAKWEQAGPGTWRAEWNAGGPVAVDFIFDNGRPVLERGWLGAMMCAPQVTR